MIASLNIKNIALIRQLSLKLDKGLNVLSGETGAGKSIIIDSLNFALGDKADKSLIRHGESFASVEVEFFFESPQKEVEDCLSELGIDNDETIIVTRSMQENGRSECRINGSMVNLSTLKRVVSLLIDVHSQHENQALLKEANHIKILDNYSKPIKSFKDEFNLALADYKALLKERDSYPSEEERARLIDIIDYQIDEIKKADIKENEEETLIAKRSLLNNFQRVSFGVNTANCCLKGGEDFSGAEALIRNAINELNHISSFLEDKELIDRLNNIKIEISDISDSLSDILKEEFDPRELEIVEKRIEEIRRIKKRYGQNLDEIAGFLQNAENEKARLLNAEERISNIYNIIRNKQKDVLSLNSQMHNERVKVAKLFEAAVLENLHALGMKNSTFKVDIAAPSNDDEILAKLVPNNGADSIVFLISPNLGEPLKQLAKIASGGEMSRFMLALKNITASLEGIDTLVFDEIDSGISGKMAKVTAQKLYNIAKDRQVIAVTHLPQLASMSDSMYLITKSESEGQTHTFINKLDENGVILEIMRLSGASEFSLSGKEAATEMRREALNYKKLAN